MRCPSCSSLAFLCMCLFIHLTHLHINSLLLVLLTSSYSLMLTYSSSRISHACPSTSTYTRTKDFHEFWARIRKRIQALCSNLHFHFMHIFNNQDFLIITRFNNQKGDLYQMGKPTKTAKLNNFFFRNIELKRYLFRIKWRSFINILYVYISTYTLIIITICTKRLRLVSMLFSDCFYNFNNVYIKMCFMLSSTLFN